MAQWSALWKTAAVGAVGDQEAGYTEAHWSVIGRILAGCANFEGVAAGYVNELEVTDVGGGDVEVDTGGAIVDGKVYNNTAAVTVNIPTPGAGTERIDRIVLRCSWAGYSVRVTRIAGVAGAAPAVPAITQTSGTTYDITLYQARITDGGVITLTDERTWADATRTALNAVDDTMVGNRVPQLYRRQGGDANSWSVVGTTTYTPGAVRMQAGAITVTVFNGNQQGNATVTFPTAFSQVPLVIGTAETLASSGIGQIVVTVDSPAADTVTLGVDIGSAATGDLPVAVYWLAIGTE